MVAKIGKRQENLLAKIAAQLGKDVEEVKEAAAPLYTTEARILEAQSVVNFYTARVRPEKRTKETEAEFEARYKAWNFKLCKQCNGEFAYSYAYDGVAYCSLECVDAALKTIGLQVTRGREPKKRWGIRHPAIVSASALEALRLANPNSAGTYDVPFQTAHPKPPEELLSPDREEVVNPLEDIHLSHHTIDSNA